MNTTPVRYPRSTRLSATRNLVSWPSALLCVLLASCILHAASSRAEVQNESRTITGSQAACETCRIIVETVVEIGDETGPGQVYERVKIRSDDEGRFIVSTRNRGLIQIFRDDGEFVGTVGAVGQGPGEYQSPIAIPSSAGGLIVLDPMQVRVTHLTEELGLIGSNPLAVRDFGDVVQLPDGSLVVAAILRTPDAFGHPLHSLTASGEALVRSFGGSGEALRRTEVITLRRVVSPATERGTFWSARGTRYRLEEWDSEGRLLTTIDREVEWFEPWTQPPTQNAREAPPRSVAIGIEEDSEGRIWTLTNVADANWKPLPPATVTETGLTSTSMEQRNRLHDTMIEVLDPNSGQLLASLRVDGYVRGFAGRGIIYTYFEDQLGQHPRFELQRLELVSTQ